MSAEEQSSLPRVKGQHEAALGGSKSGRRESRPSFQFYPGDFAGSPKVRRMTLEERGAYITLLCDSWTDRGIEPDVQSIADRLCIDAADAQRLMAGTLGRCFELVDGRLVNPRQERERERLDERSLRNAANGSAGGKASRARAKRSPSKRLANESDREAVAKPSGLGWAGPELGCAESGPEPELGKDPTRATRRAGSCTLDEQLTEFEFTELRSDIVEAARAWSGYRRERRPRISAWGPAQWRPTLRDAIKNPEAFCAAVMHSIRQKYQGLIPDRDKAKPAERLTPREASDRRHTEAWDQLNAHLSTTNPTPCLTPSQPATLSAGSATSRTLPTQTQPPPPVVNGSPGSTPR